MLLKGIMTKANKAGVGATSLSWNHPLLMRPELTLLSKDEPTLIR